MVVVGYIWKVAVNIVILCIVAWALDKLHDRNDALIISVLGMIYVTIRTTQGLRTSGAGRLLADSTVGLPVGSDCLCGVWLYRSFRVHDGECCRTRRDSVWTHAKLR